MQPDFNLLVALAALAVVAAAAMLLLLNRGYMAYLL
jgi:hypothetical protein